MNHELNKGMVKQLFIHDNLQAEANEANMPTCEFHSYCVVGKHKCIIVHYDLKKIYI